MAGTQRPSVPSSAVNDGDAAYDGRKVAIWGLGSFGGGVGAVRFLSERGAQVRIFDTRRDTELAAAVKSLEGCRISDWQLGRPQVFADFQDADLVVVNPAIRGNHPLRRQCELAGIPLSSEMNLFWQHNVGTIAAVTGSNGKSTTTAMLHNILVQTGRRCWLGGNLGISLLPQVAAIALGDFVILELSSFQLQDLNRLQVSPHVSVVTNFCPNHLDWHGDLAEYQFAKQTILRWQRARDVGILNADDPASRAWPTAGQRLSFGLRDTGEDGVFLAGEHAIVRSNSQAEHWPIREWLTLPGQHNLANALAATAAATALGATREQVAAGLKSYRALPHRLQWVGTAAGRSFYNDSLATTPESVIVALDAFHQPIHLIAGGYDKQVDLGAMAAAIALKTSSVTLIGQTAEQLAAKIAATPGCTTRVSTPQPDFATAFSQAVGQSSPGEIVLLSPGCASYDWFRNFEARGQTFTELARTWMSLQGTSHGEVTTMNQEKSS